VTGERAQRCDPEADGGDRDSHLLTLLLTGDVSAFARFYDQHSPAAYGLALRILADDEQAAGVLVDVFHAVWARAETDPPAGTSVRAWLLALIHRHAVDHMRQNPTRPFHQVLVQDTGAPTDEAGTAEQTGQRAAGQRVQAALRHVPATERQALLHAYFGGQTHGEIARHAGVSVATVDAWLHRGLRAIRDASCRVPSGDMRPAPPST